MNALKKFCNLVGRVWPLLLAICCLVIVSTDSISQSISYTHQYTIEDGLGQRVVLKVMRDQEGKFWVVTQFSIQIYDGRNFKLIDLPDGFKPMDYKTIELLNSGQIVFISDQLEDVVLDTRSSRISTIFPEENDEEPQAFVQKDELFILKTENTKIVSQVEFRTIKLALESDEESIKDFAYRGEDEIYIINESNNLSLFSNGKVEYLIDSVNVILGDINGALWIRRNADYYSISLENNIAAIPQISGKGFFHAEIFEDNISQCLIVAGADKSTAKEAFLINEDNWTDYSFILDQYPNLTDVFSHDFSSQMLCGTYTGLIYHKMNDQIKRVSVNEDVEKGKLGNVIWWIQYREKDSSLYYVHEKEGLYKMPINDLSASPGQVFPSPQLPTAFRKNFFGYYHEGTDKLLNVSHGQAPFPLHIYDFKNPLNTIKTDVFHYDFLPYDEHRLLMPGRAPGSQPVISLLDLNEEKIITSSVVEGIDKLIYNIAADGEYYWLATGQGVFKVQIEWTGGVLKTQLIDTLTLNPAFDVACINDHIYVGFASQGLGIYKDDTLVHQLTTANGLTDDAIMTIGKDSSEHIWLSTLKGAMVLSADHQILRTLLRTDGLTTNELNMGAFYCAKNGDVYLGSTNGFNVISDGWLDNTSTSTQLSVGQLEVFEDDAWQYIDVSGQVKVPYGTEEAWIRFNDYNFYKSPLHRDYIYENTFHNAHREPLMLKNGSLHLKDIPVGQSKVFWKYKSTNPPYNFEEKEIDIYRPNIFDAYGKQMAVGGGLIIFLCGWLFSRRARIRQKRKFEKAEQESKIIASRLKALRSQMNPHFIHNALGSIQYYVQKEEAQLADEYLTDFAHLMRAILEASKQDEILVQDEVHLLRLYVKLEHLRFDQKFDFEINVAPSVDVDSYIVPMVIQPFIENAINHGIYHLKEEKGMLNVLFFEEEESLICEIKDNGVGRAMAQNLREKKHRPRAMEIVNERIKLLSDKNHQNIQVDISDLEPKEHGTLVRVTFVRM